MIHGRHGKITFLVSRLVTQIGSHIAARIPRAFFRIDEIKGVVVALIKAYVVENVELDFRAPVAGVSDAGRLQILLSLLSHKARIAAVRPSGDRIAHIADQAQS